MKAPSGPHHTARSGSVSVPIYRESGPPVVFRVVWREGGRRLRRAFASEDEAKRFAGARAQALASLGAASLTLTGAESASYRSSGAQAERFGVSLDVAFGEWLAATEVLGQAGCLLAAARHYAEHVRVRSETPVADAVAAFVASKREARRSVRHLADLAGRLGKFAAAFRCPIATVTPTDVRAWLASIGPLSARSVNNYLQAVSSLAHFAQRSGWLPSSHPLLTMERLSITPQDIRILTPAEFARVRAACRHEMLPFVLLAGHCGIRHAELLRMTWGHVHLTDADPTMPHGWVEVRAGDAKTSARLGRRARRIVPLGESLAQALAPLRQGATAPLCPLVKADNQLARIAKAAGVDWSANVLRHSFGSYRLALTGDEGKVALEMGNSPAIIFAHYRAVVSARAAAEWFKL